jgi:GDPmannose 4,6-dehydratase
MKALICGVTGQDGSYLADLLLKKGYEVIETSRDAMITFFSNLKKLGIRDDVQITPMAINDFRSGLNVTKQMTLL